MYAKDQQNSDDTSKTAVQKTTQQNEAGKEQAKSSQESSFILKILALLAFIGMVTVNALASILPINGLDTGAVSDSYPNLFAPAGLTFAIWGLIYLLLLVFTLFQLLPAKEEEAQIRLKKVQILFVISSLANMAWIFAWHYRQIGISVLLMLVLLICLILIDRNLSRKKLTFKERLYLKLPFSIYFGWISVATVANITTWLVSTGWNRFGLSESLWMVMVTIIATLIALAVVSSRMNWAYGAVFVWAYAGILIKHLAPDAFAAQYTAVIVTVSICLGLIAASSLLAFFGRSFKISKKS